MESFTSISENLFESIKHTNEYNQEYWSARELMPVLEYKQWCQFSDTIERAKKACEISGIVLQNILRTTAKHHLCLMVA